MRKQMMIGLCVLGLCVACRADDDEGRQGPPGPRGAQGPAGVQGAAGIPGQDAPTRTLWGVEGAIRLVDRQRYQIQVFDALSTEGNVFLGGRILLKLGKSWEETRIEELEKELKEYNRIATQLVVPLPENGKSK